MSVQQDRREPNANRIPFEAIVEIGGQSEQANAFEAESVDLSSGGMHLRTAYLPELGQPLMCRFDGGTGQEIQAEGNVVWREEGARGGEFGIRFTNVDGGSAAALLDMCGVRPAAEPAEDDAPAPAAADRGTRVRLHIDGLGSPMKARVRDAEGGEVMVGSNLEFLRVGRTLELEDVDHGKKRAAHIERVQVEVDPASRVPQLVVALRYDDVPRSAASAPVVETTPDPVVVEAEARAAAERPPMTVRTRTAAEAADDPMDDDELEAADKMKSGLSRAALKVGPAIQRFGSRAKTTLGLLLAKAREKSGSTAEPVAARRTTAPPPGGALHATGKRIVRDDEEGMEEEIPKTKLTKNRALAIGGAAGIALVLAVVAFRKPAAPPPGATAATDVAAANAPGATDPALAAATPTPPVAPDAVQANVPLFGPTALSTTEPAAPPAPGMPGAGATAALPGAQMPGVTGPAPTMPEGATAQAEEPSSGDDSADDDKPSGDPDKAGSKKHEGKTKVPSFIHGKVSHPIVLRLPTDGSITALHGARSATGFTVTLPGRHATGSAAALSSKDPRIASVKVANGAKGAEITFAFKDGVPAYAVRAKGKDLQIALGHAADKDKDKDSKHVATAKKGGGKHVAHKAGKKD